MDIYYLVLRENTLHIVSAYYYNEHRTELPALAAGTIEEIRMFLDELGIMIDEGDEK